MADLTYRQLQTRITALTKQIARDGERIQAWATYLNDLATDTRRVSEQIGAKRVDPDTVAETSELAKIMEGVSEASLSYANTCTNTVAAANAAHEQAKRTHAGIGEAVNRSSARNIHDVDRTWLEQE